MANETSNLKAQIDAGKQILVAEISPPKSSDARQVRERARLYAGKVDALGVSDNRDGASMSALAAASLVMQEGVEPILHVVTRDRNRIALVSECLGADALGIRNILCTTGTHQTLGPARAAKNVFDIDSVQLLKAYADLASDGTIVGEKRFVDVGPLCLGAAISQHADPPEMRMMRLAKKVEAGAQFVITHPVFDVEQFQSFWTEVTNRGLHEKVAMLAGIRPLVDADSAKSYAESRPNPRIPGGLLERLATKSTATEQEAEGIAIAVDTIERLVNAPGIRGFTIESDGNDHAALSIVERSGLGAF